MKRYIDADALQEHIEKINSVDYGSMSSYEAHSAVKDCLHDVILIVESAPTADVAPVRRGEWEYLGYIGDTESWGCKECHGISEKPANYCQCCGALMKGES